MANPFLIVGRAVTEAPAPASAPPTPAAPPPTTTAAAAPTTKAPQTAEATPATAADIAELNDNIAKLATAVDGLSQRIASLARASNPDIPRRREAMRVIRCGETAHVVSKSLATHNPTIDSDRQVE